MANDYVAQQLAAIAAKKAASQAAQATPAPAAEPPPATPPPAETQAVGTSLARGGPVKPAEVSQAEWDKLPPDVQALVALGDGGQATPVNPPEAAQGLVESATGKPAEEPKRGRGRPKAVDVEATASAPAQADPVLLTEIRGLRADLAGIREALLTTNGTTVRAIEANTAATTALVEAVLGAASILAG